MKPHLFMAIIIKFYNNASNYELISDTIMA